MSDRMYAKIEIGGTITDPEVIEGLEEALKYEGFIDETQSLLNPDSMKEAFDGYTLTFEDYEASGGQFSDLEEYLEDNDIPFIRRSDGLYEYSPEIKISLPGKNAALFITDNNHNIVIQTSYLYTLMDFIMKVKNDTAPLHINEDDDDVEQHVVKILLDDPDRDAFSVLREVLEKEFPRNQTELPPFNIEKNGALLYPTSN